MVTKELVLPNGNKIPQLALGTWMIDDDKVADAVKSAIDIGYRHIDTAQAYGNERGVGDGIRQSGIARKEIFLTTKIAAEHKTYERAARSIDESLSKLGLDYIDLMIIHSPQPWVEVNQSENRYFEENRKVWRALEDAYNAGKVRAIGVSNFLQADLKNILQAAKIKPMVNQILCHISNSPLELIDWCASQGVLTEAYSPIAHGEALKNESIIAMTQKYGISVAQLCIRYCIQLGMIVLPKAAKAEHQKNNAEVDFEISGADMDILKRIERIKDYGDASFFPVFGGKL